MDERVNAGIGQEGIGMGTDGRVVGNVDKSVVGSTAILELRRKGRRNAWGPDMGADLVGHLHACAEDDNVHCCVIIGADGTFSSGADMGNEETHRVTSAGEYLRNLDSYRHPVFSALLEFRKPVISAVAGPAIGAGCVIALHTDLIMVGESAQFCLPNTRLGIVPAAGSLLRLAQWVGRGRALDIAMSGRRVGSEEALSIGLAVRRVPDVELLNAAKEYAEMLASMPPLAVWATKESLEMGLEAGSMRLARTMDMYRSGMLQMTEDTWEAHAAWREKRAPMYKLR